MLIRGSLVSVSFPDSSPIAMNVRSCFDGVVIPPSARHVYAHLLIPGDDANLNAGANVLEECPSKQVFVGNGRWL